MDIDIDFASRDRALELFNCIPASRIDGSELVRHNTGVYFQSVPIDPEKNISAISYLSMPSDSVFKIDFLNVSIYNDIKSEQHLIELMNTEPLWELLEQPEFSDLLFQLNGHGDILRTMKPKSITELAAVISIIRPAKRYLIGKDWDTVLKEVWIKPSNGDYYFKKSHAHSYAVLVAIHMNLLCDDK